MKEDKKSKQLECSLKDILNQSFFYNRILLQDGDKELSSKLKAKVMDLRLRLNKIQKQYQEDVREAYKNFAPENFETDRQNVKTQLQELEKKGSPEELETKRQLLLRLQDLDELDKKARQDVEAFSKQQEEKNYPINLRIFTRKEYFEEIVNVNSGRNVEYFHQKLNQNVMLEAGDFLEIIAENFVELETEEPLKEG